MSVRIKVHRGTNQIGGTITEIATEKSRIFIDFGCELSVEPENSTDQKMIDMIQQTPCDAVLFSHYHGDHVGLMEYIPEETPKGDIIWLCMGKVARNVLINIQATLAGNKNSPRAMQDRHRHILELLKDKNRWRDIEDGIPFRIGDFTVTPCRVDHSAYDSYLFIIEAEGKCIVHTGDFRTHGRLGENFFKNFKQRLQEKQADVLLIEGTMLSRPDKKVYTEREMEADATRILGKPENKYAFLVCSSTNLESLASFHNAALKLGRPFLVNNYVHKQLELFRNTVGKREFDFRFWKSYKFEPPNKFNSRMGMTQLEYMRKQGFLMLVKENESYKERMNMFKEDNPLLIYSMWDGYLDEESIAYNKELRRLYDGWRHIKLHTSGHASVRDLENMILTVHPKKYIIPIHTERKYEFENLDIGNVPGKIKCLDDGEIILLEQYPEITESSTKPAWDPQLTTQINRIYGGLYGFCVGDALGVPVEFSTREECKEDPVCGMRGYGTHHQPFGTWSDDTSLTLCLIDAINKGYSVKRTVDNFVAFYKKGAFTPYGKVFDIGISTSDAIEKMCSGINPVDCGGISESDNGNGSLMRILPLTFSCYKMDTLELIATIEEISSLTHRHPRSKFACIFYVKFALCLYENYEKEKALDETIIFMENNCKKTYTKEWNIYGRILSKKLLSLPENEIRSTGYVVDTLEAALWSFFHGVNYREAVLLAVNLGGDTDTIAAITGGIAGIYYGITEIPKEWLDSLAKKEMLFQMFQHFSSLVL